MKEIYIGTKKMQTKTAAITSRDDLQHKNTGSPLYKLCLVYPG